MNGILEIAKRYNKIPSIANLKIEKEVNEGRRWFFVREDFAVKGYFFLIVSPLCEEILMYCIQAANSKEPLSRCY